MPALLHRNVPLEENHRITTWVVADSSALNAISVTEEDVDKVARVGSGAASKYYALASASPVIWSALNEEPEAPSTPSALSNILISPNTGEILGPDGELLGMAQPIMSDWYRNYTGLQLISAWVGIVIPSGVVIPRDPLSFLSFKYKAIYQHTGDSYTSPVILAPLNNSPENGFGSSPQSGALVGDEVLLYPHPDMLPLRDRVYVEEPYVPPTHSVTLYSAFNSYLNMSSDSTFSLLLDVTHISPTMPAEVTLRIRFRNLLTAQATAWLIVPIGSLTLGENLLEFA